MVAAAADGVGSGRLNNSASTTTGSSTSRGRWIKSCCRPQSAAACTKPTTPATTTVRAVEAGGRSNGDTGDADEGVMAEKKPRQRENSKAVGNISVGISYEAPWIASVAANGRIKR